MKRLEREGRVCEDFLWQLDTNVMMELTDEIPTTNWKGVAYWRKGIGAPNRVE